MNAPPFLYASNITPADAARRLRAAQRILITTHSKPDGDAIGSVLALRRALAQLGKSPAVWIMGPLEPPLRALMHQSEFELIETPSDDQFDLILILDTGSASQLEPIAPWLRARRDIVLGIDHHRGGEDLAAQRIVDIQAASTTIVLRDVIEELGVRITGERGGIAEALFVGLATDTGWFKYANADARAFESAAALLRAGVNKSVLYEILEETYPVQRLAIQGLALNNIEYLRNGTVAIQTVKMSDLASTGAKSEDLTGLVNNPMVVRSVRISILVSQFTRGVTKLSFRSKPRNPDAPPTPADDLVDVNQFARRFGGGGHIHAAGARMNMDLEQARALIVQEINTPR